MKLRFNVLSNPLLYLWPLVLVKKELFFVVEIFYLFFNIGKIKFLKQVLPLLILGIIQILSTILVVITGFTGYERVFAAINTAFIWILGSFIFCIFLEKRYSYIDCGKIAFLNLLILFILTIFGVISFRNNTPIVFLNRNLFNIDYNIDSSSFRCNCFFEYSTLIPYFILINFPFAFFYFKKKNIFKMLLLLMMSLISAYYSKARWGFLLVIIVALSYIYLYYLKNYLNKKNKLICLFFIGVFCLFLMPNIYNFFVNILNSRIGSNNMRAYIYITSINTTIDKNFLFGCGVKFMIGDYPLGSHSSIIGAFYKTGFVGFFIFVLIYSYLFIYSFKLIIKKRYEAITIIVILLFMIFEDIDGTNWMLPYFLFLLVSIKKKFTVYKNSNYNFLKGEYVYE